MPDTVTLTLDAEQYYRELAKVTAGTQRLSRTGAGIGEGFLRGDRVIRTATGNIVQALGSANSAADAALVAFQSLERVFRIPIGATIGVAAGVAAFAVIKKEIDKTTEAVEALRKATSSPIRINAGLSPEDITQQLLDSEKAIEALEARVHGPFETARRALDIGLGEKPIDQEDVNRGISDQKRLTDEIVRSRTKITDVQAVELTGDKEALDLAKSRLTFELAIAAARSHAREHPELAGAEAGIEADLKRQRDIRDQLIKQQKAQRDLAEEQAAAEERHNLLLDMASGKFLKDLAQKQKDQASADAMAAQLADFRNTDPSKLGPNALAMLAAADAAGLGPQPQANVGRAAGIGESQDLVNQIEANRLAFERQNQILDGVPDSNYKEGGTGTSMTPDDLIRSAEGFQSLSEHSMDLSDDFIRMSEGLSGLNQQISDLDFRGLAPLSGLTISIQ